MLKWLECEFFLVRFVPDIARGEFANIGVILRERGRPEGVLVQFTRDWSKVLCLSGDADTEMLEALEAEIDASLREETRSAKPILSLAEDTFSNGVQVTQPQPCLAESLRAEMDLLMRIYVEPVRPARLPRAKGRAAIVATMRREFERTGVWSIMRKRIPAAEYTGPGDGLKLDCGYRPNGVIRMFQAVSLRGDVDAAKALAFSASRLRDGVERVEQAMLELTAIVEPVRSFREDDEAVERYRFGVLSMEEQQIRVLTTTDLPRVAERARLDMRL